MLKKFEGHKIITGFSTLLILLTCAWAFFINPRSFNLPTIAYVFMLFFLIATFIFSLISYRQFTLGFLLSLFTLLTAWRIAGIYSIITITFPLLLVFILMFSNFIYCARSNLNQLNSPDRLSLGEWQLIFVRLYIGFNFVIHFTEKLFAGPLPHQADVNAFIQLGIPHPDLFVWLAGLCEFGAAVAIGLGFMMRIGAVCSAFYLFICTYLGRHFTLGFIWANSGGGWEYPVLWTVLVLSFAWTGYHKFTIDEMLEGNFNLPNWVRKLL